jgi:hypothetical protein
MILKRVSGDIYDAIQIHLKTWPIGRAYMSTTNPVPMSCSTNPTCRGCTYPGTAPCNRAANHCNSLRRSTSRRGAGPPTHGPDNTHPG